MCASKHVKSRREADLGALPEASLVLMVPSTLHEQEESQVKGSSKESKKSVLAAEDEAF